MREKKIRLENFDTVLNPLLLDRASALYQASAVKTIRKLSRSLFEIEVLDNNRIADVEILLGLKQIKSCTCPCESFTPRRLCVHVGTALYALRNSLETDQKKEEIKHYKPKQSINMRTVLDNVDERSLKKFIAQQSRKNRALSIALKSTFLDKIEIEPDRNKYALLLNDLVRVLPNGTLDLPMRDFRILNDVVVTFHDQYDVAFAGLEYRTCLDILSALLSKLQIAFAKTQELRSELIPLLNATYERYSAFLFSSIAPELRQSAMKFGFKLARRYTYALPSFGQNIFQSLHAHCRNPIDEEKLWQILDDHLSRVEDTLPWLAVAVSVGLQLRRNSDVAILLENKLSSTQESVLQVRLNPLLQYLQNHEDDIATLFVYASQKKLIKDHPDQATIHRIAYQSAKNENMLELAFDCGIQLFLKNESRILLKELNQSRLKAGIQADAIVHAINTVDDPLKQARLRCLYFSEENAVVELIKEINRAQNAVEFFKHAAQILNAHLPESDKLLTQYVLDHVSRHVGTQSGVFVQRLQEILSQNEREDLRKIIVDELRKSFPERISLSRSISG